ncbi:T9SS type A sorting domain-containing protein, partial [Crocinitomix catalasitica]|nr:T9SS type A sorting domain-containing protein [Crocinitomix catalasitica]
ANIDISGSPTSILFNGNNSSFGDCCAIYDEWQITILEDGCIIVDWNFVNPDIEELGYSIDGIYTIETSTTSSGLWGIPLSIGEVFGVRITTFDDCCGMGTVTLSNFQYNPDTGGPVPDVDPLPDTIIGCGITIVGFPTAFDACDGPVTATTTDPLVYTAGTYVITWEYTDSQGNITTQTQNITVEDNEAPVPDNPSLPDLAGCNVTVTTVPTATDECDGSTVVATTTNPLFYDESGFYIITWTFDDGVGNISTQTQNVIISNPVNGTGVVTHTLGPPTGSIDYTVTGPFIPPIQYDWDNDGTGDFDDTEDLTGLTAGTYIVVAMDALGCQDIDTFQVLNQLTVEELSQYFEMYPNPTDGAFQIKTNTEEFIGQTLFITNAVGQVILTSTIQKQTTNIDLSSFETGIYFVSVGDKNTNIGKVIKR